MARLVDILSDAKIRAAKPADRPKRLFDGRGLYLQVQPNGTRAWRLKYRFAGREKLLALGVYPDVTLKRARDLASEARRDLEAGRDPSARKRQEKLRARVSAETSFKAIATEYLAQRRDKLAPATVAKQQWILDDLLLPWIGARPIADITAQELLAQLRRIEARGKLETAHRTHQLASRIFRFAIATGRAERNVAADLQGALQPVKVRNHAAVTSPDQVGELLRKLHGYSGQPVTCAALKLAPLLFVRPGELRHAEWTEFDLEATHPVWILPAEKTKMRREHLVPLSRQAVEILADLEPLTGRGRFVFPGVRTAARPMSEASITAALRAMGYSGQEMTWHGFRAMASTLLHELGWRPDVIEVQLAHAQRSKVAAAYNRAQFLPERRRMMQAWSDHLDALRAGAKVVAIGSAKDAS